MDWFSWLSKTGLERSLVYEYGTAFSYNELGEDDISYFNHEFLQSIGVTVAKHRLEILKLAGKDGGKGVNLGTRHRPVSRLVGTIKNTKASISEYVKKWILRRDKGGAFAFPRPCTYGDRWKASMLRRNQKLLPGNRSRTLLVCNGSPVVLSSTPRVDSFSSLMVYAFSKEENKIGKENGGGGGGGGGGGHWSSGVEETRWDCMFHNLKPT